MQPGDGPALMAVQLKTLRRLGNFIAMACVPKTIVKHICARCKIQPFDTETHHRYDLSGSKPSRQRRLREFVGLRLLDAAAPE